MILVTAISHKDIDLATRLYKWIRFLAKERSLKRKTVLLVASPLADRMERMIELLNTANATFEESYLYVPAEVDESGWPKSCNDMFQKAMFHAEPWNEYALWLEPDAVPLVPEWFDAIESEFDMAWIAGKSFMGAYVPKHAPHMSGVGVYGRNWRSVAPKLIEARTEPWDTFAADQVVPHAHFTKLIQHLHDPPKVIPLDSISEDAVIYHQCKTGSLIKMLDQAWYGGELYANADDIIADLTPMPKYFHARNAMRNIAGVQFQIYANRAGTAFGVYEATTDAEIAALTLEAQNPRSAVEEITEEAYTSAIKKKPRSINGVQTLNRPIVPVNPLQGLAQAVAGEKPSTSPEPPPPQAPLFEKKEQFLRTGELPKIRRGRPRKVDAPSPTQ